MTSPSLAAWMCCCGTVFPVCRCVQSSAWLQSNGNADSVSRKGGEGSSCPAFLPYRVRRFGSAPPAGVAHSLRGSGTWLPSSLPPRSCPQRHSHVSALPYLGFHSSPCSSSPNLAKGDFQFIIPSLLPMFPAPRSAGFYFLICVSILWLPDSRFLVFTVCSRSQISFLQWVSSPLSSVAALPDRSHAVAVSEAVRRVAPPPGLGLRIGVTGACFFMHIVRVYVEVLFPRTFMEI